jgi:16S rRNA (adenine1518-N6/adenine1519-N6)-dimethyltransferase
VTDLLTPASIRRLLADHGITPSRALGQNFLADPNTARRIVRLAALPAGAKVVEVGPGLGSLTLALCEAGASVVAIELDQYLRPVLEQVTAGMPVTVVAGDAMEIDWSALLGNDPVAMVANLPYNVATPVVMRALETAPMITTFLVMVQREVGERLAAGPGSRVYGAVSVKVAFHGSAEVVGIVPPTVFHPRPKVDSALVRIVRRAEPPVQVHDPERMFAIVRAGFATRRKSLRQSLRSALGDRTDAVLAAAGIEPLTRAEQLGLPEWAALANAERSQ